MVPSIKGRDAQQAQKPHLLLQGRAAAPQEQGRDPQLWAIPKRVFNPPRPPKSYLNIPQSSKQSSQASQYLKTLKTHGSNKPKTQ